MIAEPVGQTGNGGGAGAEDYILIRDEKSSGTNGGTFTTSAWQTRDLNVEVVDTGGHASLATNQITLAAGTYRVKAHAPALQVNNHKVKLYNITDAVDLIIGSSAYASSFAAVSNKSFLEGRFTIEDSKILELQHRCGATKTNNGFGLGSGFVVTEVYSVIEFWKEA